MLRQLSAQALSLFGQNVADCSDAGSALSIGRSASGSVRPAIAAFGKELRGRTDSVLTQPTEESHQQRDADSPRAVEQ
jgi:hypothetical protein